MTAELPQPASIGSMLAQRQPIDMIWLSLASVSLAEIAAQAGPAAIVLDLQHGLWDRLSIENVIGVVSRTTSVLARVTENRPHAISQALDAGAAGVIVPFIETAEEAAFAVSCSRYAPLGKRSSGGTRPLLRGIDPNSVNRDVVVGVMIETMAGVAAAEAIASTPGVDFVFIGPGDLRVSKGVATRAEIQVECDHIMTVCAARNTPCGIFTMSRDSALSEFDAGYALAVTASDFGLARAGFSAATAAMSRYRA
jgi:2-keto-3-deoxy-L-rhamnonate aldolase RhmA